MIYFVFWVVFLLAVLLAVPVAALIEKRKYNIDNPASPTEEAADESIDPEPPLEQAAELAEVEGGEEFPAFDEID